jgi:hypothetical protein|tara:strand:- start:228 stop:1493 length:1266 start_codon:yes stop_codon:yes gene_type:complete
MTCPKCGSDYIKKNGKRGEVQRYKCNNCKKGFSNTDDFFSDSNISTSSMVEELNYVYITDNVSDGKAPTLQTLLEKFNVSEEEWKVTNFKVNQWDVSAKEEVDGKIVWNTHTNYQARASLVRKRPVKCDFPSVQGATVGDVKLNVKTPKRKLNLDIVLPDAQVGFKRDIHSGELTPLHDLKAIAIATEIIKEIKPDRIIMLGDMLDLPDWSTHYIRSPEFYFTTQPSLDWLASWIKELRPYCEEMVYIEGNHEKRMIDSIVQNTIQAYGIKPANEPDVPPIVSVPYMLGLHKMGVEYIGNYPHGEFYINDNLVCIHGNKVGPKSGQSVMKMLDSPRISVIQGHVHRLEMGHKTVWSHGQPKIYQAVSLGTLARINGVVPGGGTRYNWQQGFGIVEYDNDRFQIDSVGIYDGKAIFKGKFYG